MIEVISVKFKNRGKCYFFAPNGLQVRNGEKVIVETAKGLEIADCCHGNHMAEDTAVVQPLRNVVRIATVDDLRVEEINKKREKEALVICAKKIEEHGLDMKLVDVECNFEGNKTTFFFTSNGRVDFRELVKDLAGVFRNRIELRQIGVRDEAKMIGGLGICGRPFCCSQFLNGFLPVSIKMAKTQNLSLNPAKISGTCGRLMCCLKYEQNAYEDAAKRMPKAESFVQTPDGPGNVKSVDLLRETVKVSLDSAPEPFKCYHNCEICVLRNGKGSREGIVIPDQRPERYVEEAEEDPFEAPIFTPLLYADLEREEPMREKIGGPGTAGETKRRHRGGRRRGKSGESKAAEPKKEQPKAADAKAEGEDKSRRPRRKSGKPPAQEETPRSAAPAAETAGESGESKRRRRPHHRGGRRHSKGGAPAGQE